MTDDPRDATLTPLSASAGPALHLLAPPRPSPSREEEKKNMEGTNNGAAVSVGSGTVINYDDILLLKRIEDDSNTYLDNKRRVDGLFNSVSVSTADLLTMLERNVVDASASASSNNDNDNDNDNNRNRNRSRTDSADAIRATAPSSLSRVSSGDSLSGDSLRGSFTSRLLGGRTDDVDDLRASSTTFPPTSGIEDDDDEYDDERGVLGASSKDDNDDVDADAIGTVRGWPSSRRNGNHASGSDASSSGMDGGEGGRRRVDGNSVGGGHGLPPAAGQSFDNPFRRRGPGLKVDRIGGGGLGDHRGYDADVGGDGDRGHPGNEGDVGSTSAASAASLGALLLRRDASDRPRGQNSVTFSIREENNDGLGARNDDVDRADGRSLSGNASKSIKSSVDTFSLGSLSGVTVSTRSSKSSRQSSRSSKSSKSSRGSATTASTHSSGDSMEERRRRRELVPVVKPGGPSSMMSPSMSDHRHHRRAKKSTATTVDAISTAVSPVDASASMFGSKYKHKGNRRKTPPSGEGGGDGLGKSLSRNLLGNRLSGGRGRMGGNDEDEEDEEGEAAGAFHGKNLHDHHPVRYPKRSSHYNSGRIDEGNEVRGDDFDFQLHGHGQGRGDVGGSGAVDDASNGEDGDGLFRRVGRIRDGVDSQGGGKRSSRDDFLDDLIASTTATARRGNGDDAASVGETSFLSELLTKNNPARHRAGRRNVASSVVSISTSGKSADLSTMSSHTDNSSEKVEFINIYGGDASKKQQKQKLRSYHQWRANVATIKQHCDRVVMMVRRSHAYKKIEMFVNEGGNMLPQSIRESHAFSRMAQFYNDGGEVLPRDRKEVAILLVCALLLWPIMHVAITITTGGGSATGRSSVRSGRNSDGYFGSEIQLVSSSERAGGSRRHKMGTAGLFSTGESMNVWAGSSQVMLSKFSSLRENFILIPEADWIELQIIRSKAASMQLNRPKSDGGFLSSFFQKSSSTYVKPRKPPTRLPLPSMIDPVYNSSASMVLFSFTRIPLKKYTGDVKYENAMLWRAIERSLHPRPLDVWPCWSHNSLAQVREDGFTLMYPYSMRDEARMALTKLAKNLGRYPVRLYEYVTWSESSPNTDLGGGINVQGKEGASVEESAGILRLAGKFVGKNGSAIVIPALPNGRSDIMIRRTISTASSSSDSEQELAVVMRRVKDLPVEDELTMREWKGPPPEEISFN